MSAVNKPKVEKEVVWYADYRAWKILLGEEKEETEAMKKIIENEKIIPLEESEGDF